MRPSPLRFAEFELDPERYQLRRGNREVELEPMPMELLILLLEKRGSVVERDEIIETLWGKEKFVDSRDESEVVAMQSDVARDIGHAPVGQAGNYTPPSNLPVNPSIDTFTQPIEQVNNMDACTFFQTMSTMMMSNPPRNIDVLVQKPLQALGLLTPNRPFSCGNLPDPHKSTSASAAMNYWSFATECGDYGINYILMALVAQKALGANRPQDAVYGYGAYGRRGIDDANKLDGANRYVVHFKPETNAHIIPAHVLAGSCRTQWQLGSATDNETVDRSDLIKAAVELAHGCLKKLLIIACHRTCAQGETLRVGRTDGPMEGGRRRRIRGLTRPYSSRADYEAPGARYRDWLQGELYTRNC